VITLFSWIYVSNAEIRNGGVGAITFNSLGQVTDYTMIADGTKRNCGGGKTYWNTWVTCEEFRKGQVYEVDPYTGKSSQQLTALGGKGGAYESFAYDARDRLNPTFYVTHDSSFGGLVRFTPDPTVVVNAEASKDYSKVLTTMGTLHWLMLSPSSGSASATSGTFYWTSKRAVADANARAFYRASEGIDIRNGTVYFVTKKSKSLYILDLDARTYVRSSTQSSAFDGQPDQVARILAEDESSDMLYFCEEKGDDEGGTIRVCFNFGI